MSPRPARAFSAAIATAGPEARRLAVMRSLVIEDWLPGEWDPVRQLLIPRQDGLLSRRRACAVPACLGDGTSKTGPLCRSHANQLAQAGAASAEEWIAAGGPRPLRRYLSLETCRVSDDEGELCPRPSWASRLCIAHSKIWGIERKRGSTLEEFLARARPLTSFGDCTAGSCFLAAAHETGLCELHYRLWNTAGHPQGEDLEAWRRRTRQPTSRLVLSLRGLPELVRLEVLYALQRRLAEQVRTLPEAVTTLVDELRLSDVGSVLDFDLAIYDRKRNNDKGRLARFTFDRVALAYRDPETEIAGDRWDLRVFSRRGSSTSRRSARTGCARA